MPGRRKKTASATAGKADKLAALEKAVSAEPDNPDSHYALGAAYEEAGREDDADLCFRRAAIAGAADPACLRRCAGAFIRLGRWPMAVLLARISLTLEETADGRALLARILAATGRYQPAMQAARRALALEPENLLCQATLADIVRASRQRLDFDPEKIEGGRIWSVHLEGETPADPDSQ